MAVLTNASANHHSQHLIVSHATSINRIQLRTPRFQRLVVISEAGQPPNDHANCQNHTMQTVKTRVADA